MIKFTLDFEVIIKSTLSKYEKSIEIKNINK